MFIKDTSERTVFIPICFCFLALFHPSSKEIEILFAFRVFDCGEGMCGEGQPHRVGSIKGEMKREQRQ